MGAMSRAAGAPGLRQARWSRLTFLLFLMVTRMTPGTGFMPSFCIALRLFFSERLCLPRPEPSSSARRGHRKTSQGAANCLPRDGAFFGAQGADGGDHFCPCKRHYAATAARYSARRASQQSTRGGSVPPAGAAGNRDRAHWPLQPLPTTKRGPATIVLHLQALADCFGVLYAVQQCERAIITARCGCRALTGLVEVGHVIVIIAADLFVVLLDLLQRQARRVSDGRPRWLRAAVPFP